jgi:hypothetical protein
MPMPIPTRTPPAWADAHGTASTATAANNRVRLPLIEEASFLLSPKGDEGGELLAREFNRFLPRGPLPGKDLGSDR